MILKALIIGVLLLIFLQDIKSKSVNWVLFPVLAMLLFSLYLAAGAQPSDLLNSVSINAGFLLLQYIAVTACFSLKNRRWINITTDLLGWGDILLMICLALYLSVLNFLFFYTSSLIIVLGFVLIQQICTVTKNKLIPLAGFQAIIFIVFLASDWWVFHQNITDDHWLLHLLMK